MKTKANFIIRLHHPVTLSVPSEVRASRVVGGINRRTKGILVAPPQSLLR
jgi:hypothetical protein